MVVGLIATAVIFYACYLVGEKKASGFLFSIAGQVLWIIRGVYWNLPDVIITSWLFLGLGVYNYLKWTAKPELKIHKGNL